MKPLIILCLIISMNVQAQNCFRDVQEQNQNWQPAQIENYVGGAMLIGTFATVELIDPVLYRKYYPDNATAYKNQRALIAVSCMATTFVTYAVIRKIRINKHQKRLGY